MESIGRLTCNKAGVGIEVEEAKSETKAEPDEADEAETGAES